MYPIESLFAFENTWGDWAPQFSCPVVGSTSLHSEIVSGSEHFVTAGPPPTATAADRTLAVAVPTKSPNGRSSAALCEPTPSRPFLILTAVILSGSVVGNCSKQSLPLPNVH